MVKHIYTKLVSLILLMLPLQLIAQTNISGNMPLQERQLTGIERHVLEGLYRFLLPCLGVICHIIY